MDGACAAIRGDSTGIATERQEAFERKDLVANEAVGFTIFCRRANIVYGSKVIQMDLERVNPITMEDLMLVLIVLRDKFVVGRGRARLVIVEGVDEKVVVSHLLGNQPHPKVSRVKFSSVGDVQTWKITYSKILFLELRTQTMNPCIELASKKNFELGKGASQKSVCDKQNFGSCCEFETYIFYPLLLLECFVVVSHPYFQINSNQSLFGIDCNSL